MPKIENMEGKVEIRIEAGLDAHQKPSCTLFATGHANEASSGQQGVTTPKVFFSEIEDEAVLNQLMEDVAFYAGKKDIVDQLSPNQVDELDKAIEEVNNKEAISWGAFKREMKEWKKK